MIFIDQILLQNKISVILMHIEKSNFFHLRTKIVKAINYGFFFSFSSASELILVFIYIYIYTHIYINMIVFKPMTYAPSLLFFIIRLKH